MAKLGKTAVFGIGAMGSALVKGWIASGRIRPSGIRAVDIDPMQCRKASSRLGIRAGTDPRPALKGAGLVLLAVKPQQMRSLLAAHGRLVPRKALVVSIAAGVSTGQIERFLPQGCPVVRVMPNTPALLGAGMSAVAPGRRAKAFHVRTVLGLFGAVGKAVKVREDQMDLVTALSGSGPAYWFHLMEILQGTAVKGGLPPVTAHLLVSQTALGAARMVLESGKTPAELRIQVTSPGGTTQAALETFARRGLRRTVEAAVQAAHRRGAQLRKANG